MPTFSDISEDHPYYDAIEWAAANGITIGYPDGTYRSDRALSRGEMAVFLQRFDGAAPPDPDPPNGDVVVNPGDSIQAAVDDNPTGTSFLLGSGVHVHQQVEPKRGMVFMGEPGAIMDGGGVTAHAFFASLTANTVTDVTISGLLIRDYLPPLDYEGSVQASLQSGWQLLDCEITGSRYAGAYLGAGAIVRRCFIHHNNRAGLKVRNGGYLVESNELSFNNFQDLEDPVWDVGGLKAAFGGTGGIIRNNNAHDNHGAGLWVDIDNDDVLIENNTVEDNTHTGIVTEISSGTVIRNNVCNRNGLVYGGGWGWGNGIQIQSSDNVEIYDNILDGNYNGIMIVENGRNNHNCDNANIHDNEVNNSIHWAIGGVEGGRSAPYGLFTTFVNDFQGNTYSGNPSNGWRWNVGNRTFSEWQSTYGYDN